MKNYSSLYLYIGAITCFFFFFLHTNYTMFSVDDSWSISNAWNIVNKGVHKDLIFLEESQPGYNQYFSVTYYYLVGTFLNQVGWLKSNIYFLNSAFVIIASILWYFSFLRLSFSKTVASSTALFLPLLPPFFFAAHSGRIDAFLIFIIALQFFLFIRKNYFLAAVLTGIAIETHPMGIIGLIFCGVYFVHLQQQNLISSKQFLHLFSKFLLGAILSIGYYFNIHSKMFQEHELWEVILTKSDMKTPINDYIINYFTRHDWYFHLWEAALLLGAVGLFFYKKMYRKNKFLLLLLLGVFIASIITRRENGHYFAFIFPAFALLYFYVFEQFEVLAKASKILLAILLIQYGSIGINRWGFNIDKMYGEISQDLEKEEQVVIGTPDFWFAAKERDFRPLYYYRDINLDQTDIFYYLEADYQGERIRNYEELKGQIYQQFECQLLKEYEAFNSKKVKLLECNSIYNSHNELGNTE